MIVEAIVVLISLVFIWQELRLNNRLARAANNQALVELSSPFNLQLIQDREMAELWAADAQQVDSFDRVDANRYKDLITWWLILHENIYYQWQNGLLDDVSYLPWERDLKGFVRAKNLERRWDGMKWAFQEAFAAHIDVMINTQTDDSS